MDVQEYQLFIKIDEKEFNIDPTQINFRIEYSIYSILPKAFVTINDLSAILQESLLLAPGTKIDILFGKDNKFLDVRLNVDYDLIDDVQGKNSVNGLVELPMIHRMQTLLEPISRGFEDRISNVVRTVLDAHKNEFNDIVVNDTENDEVWLQPYVNDFQFIDGILRERASSRNSKNTPFFNFIDEHNNFQFRNYKSMLGTNERLILEYREVTERSSEEDNSGNIIKVLDLARKHKSYLENLRDYKRHDYYIDEDTGELDFVESKLGDYSDLRNIKIPMVQYKKDVSAWSFHCLDNKESVENKVINNSRHTINQDSFVCVCNFNPELIVGTPITLKVYYTALNDSSSEEVSQYSGKYLITHTKQIYDGNNGSYLSVLVIDRKGTKLSGNYLRKDVFTDI